MKKKLLALVLCMAMVLCLGACGGKEEAPEEEVKTVTVTFKNGTTKLGSLKVKVGETLTDYAQFENQEGYLFQGWFATPTFLESSRQDLTSATFGKNTTLYGSFKNLNVTEDTRKWYVVGDGTSTVLSTSAWAGSSVSEEGKEACRLMPTGKVTNEFAITIDLYEGDLFQVIHDWQWDGQYGFGKVTECDASQMESSGGLSGEATKANIKVLVSGNYTITLTTDPDNANQDTLVIVRNGDAAPAQVVEKEPYVVSDSTQVLVKGSWVSDWSENIELTRTAGTSIYTLTKEFAAGTELYFMVWDNGKDTGIGMKNSSVTDAASKALIDEADNVKLSAAGTYTFTVDAEALTITIKKAE
ncbi:MAG: hypothetical protein K6B75_02745 [Lachnospiraceae bacterium]|nr:hypothetical protein [Lachnospiraceae bacterium]